jgi:cobalt-zinc-cadmium efflux system membrane fusion protein
MKKILIFTLLIVFAACSDKEVKETVQTEEPAPKQEISIIKLDAKQVAEITINVAAAEKGTAEMNIIAPGQVYPSPDKIAVVAAPLSGRIKKIYVHEGDQIAKGNPLVEIESLEYANMIAEYLQYRAELDYSQSQVDRLEQLSSKKISSKSEFEKAKADLGRLKALLSAAKSRLLAVGVSQSQIDKWISGDAPEPIITVNSPISGFLNEHLIDMGQAVETYEKLLTVISTDEVMIKGYLSPNEGNGVFVGDSVSIINRKYKEGGGLASIVKSINPALDNEKKSIIANIIVKTNGGCPMPGQAVTLSFQSRTQSEVITIPAEAIIYDGKNAAVFVQKSDSEYEKRYIEVLRSDDAKAIVTGVKEGEKVAINELFTLKALSRYEQFAE